MLPKKITDIFNNAFENMKTAYHKPGILKAVS